MVTKYRALFAEAKAEMKKNGVRALFRKYGWKLVAIVFTGYLVRDVTLYIILPWFVARRLIAE